jgi:hypothetical protein
MAASMPGTAKGGIAASATRCASTGASAVANFGAAIIGGTIVGDWVEISATGISAALANAFSLSDRGDGGGGDGDGDGGSGRRPAVSSTGSSRRAGVGATATIMSWCITSITTGDAAIAALPSLSPNGLTGTGSARLRTGSGRTPDAANAGRTPDAAGIAAPTTTVEAASPIELGKAATGSDRGGTISPIEQTSTTQGMGGAKTGACGESGRASASTGDRARAAGLRAVVSTAAVAAEPFATDAGRGGATFASMMAQSIGALSLTGAPSEMVAAVTPSGRDGAPA